jgi:sulfofructose kinase
MSPPNPFLVRLKGMTTILLAGVAVIDFVFRLDTMPRAAEKYRATDAAISGGGCAANAAVAIARLGGRACLAARLGADPVGDMIVSGLEGEGVDCSLAKRFDDCRSSFSSVYVDAVGERQIVNFRDPSLSFDASWLTERLPDAFDAALADTRWPQGAAALLLAARRKTRPGVLDAEAPIAEAKEAMAAASHIAFSMQGLRDYSGRDDVEWGLRKVVDETGAWACVTDGSKGVTFLSGKTLGHVPAFAVESVDTLGAGDVWHGAFALGLGEGMQEIAAIRFANAVAAMKCTRFGGRAGIPRRPEVEEFMRTHQ